MSGDQIAGTIIVLFLVAVFLLDAYLPDAPADRHVRDLDPPSAPPVVGQYVHVHRVEQPEPPPPPPAPRARAWVEYEFDPLTGEVLEEPTPRELEDEIHTIGWHAARRRELDDGR